MNYVYYTKKVDKKKFRSYVENEEGEVVDSEVFPSRSRAGRYARHMAAWLTREGGTYAARHFRG